MAKNDSRSQKTYLRSFSELLDRVAGTGLVVPQALEIEQSVLGACMIDKAAAQRVFDTIGDRDSPFYSDKHKSIYHAISKLIAAKEPIDLLSVTERLRKEGELEDSGGPAYLVELTSKVVTTANVEAHARLLIEKHLQRELITKCEELKLRAFIGEDDTFDILTDAEVVIAELSNTRHHGAPAWRTTEEVGESLTRNLEALAEKGMEVTGIPSGLSDLDRLTDGWQPTDLVILAARTSQGKTALMLNFARNAALDRNTGVAVFSLEMKDEPLMMRLICSESGLNLSDVRRGNLDSNEWRRYHEAKNKLRNAPIYFDSTAALTPQDLRAKVRQLKAKKNIELIIVDYMQLMELPAKTFSNSDSREREISKISRSLKNLTLEIGIPIIALSQLSRAVEARHDKRPQLSDLRESGSLEQDSDLVLFIYRPEIYGFDDWKYPFNDAAPTKGEAEIIVGKQRNGAIGSVRVKFDPKCGDFSDRVIIPEFIKSQEDMIF